MPANYHTRVITAAHQGALGDIDSGALSPAAWQASTAYNTGDLVQPATPNAHYYECTTAGTSASSEPDWPTDGSTVTDGGAVWTDRGGVGAVWAIYAGAQPPSAEDPVSGYSAWAASTAYSVGDLVQPTTGNGHYYRCTAAGTSGSSEPTWPTDGSSVTDGGATWEDHGDIPTRLGTITCANPAGTVDGATGELTFAAMTRDEDADADGTISFARLVNGDGNACLDLPAQAGTSAVSGYAVFNTLSVVSGGPIEMLSATIG